MILIGIGANLPSTDYGAPRVTCGAALETLSQSGIIIGKCSRWYESAPVPASDQPWFVNAVLRVRTALGPDALMTLLIETEKVFGRQRNERNAARILDLDLLAYGDLVLGDDGIQVPHPRMSERAFVLLPLRDVAPDWCHPANGEAIATLIGRLPPDQEIRPMPDARGLHGTEWRDRPPAITPADNDGA